MQPSIPAVPDDFGQRCGALSVRQACLPAGVDPIEQDRLERIVRRRRLLAPGDRLFRVGDPMQGLFVSRSGALKATTVSRDGDEQILAFHLSGELIGLDGLGHDRHRCEVVALEDAEVCELGFDELIDAARGLPHLRAQLHRVVGHSIARDADHAAMLTRKLAHERLAAFLHDLLDRHCLLGRASHSFRLPMSREDIARFLGLTLESVSRSIGRLQELGLIRARGRQVEIIDPAELTGIAGRH